MGRKADKRVDLKMPPGAWQTYKRLLGYLRPHKAMFGVGVVGMTIFAATDAGWAAFVKFFLDGTFVDKDPRMVWLVPVALVGLFLLRGIGDFMQTYCPGFVGRHIVKTLRGQIFERYVHLPVAYFDTHPSGVLLSKLTYNTEQVATATTDSVTVFIRDTLTIIGLIGYLLYLNPKLTLISLIVGPLIAGFRRLHPDIRFELDADASDVPAFENYDITLLTTDEGFDGPVVARRILTVEAVLVAAPSYLQRRGEPQRPQDLSDHDCLRMRRPGQHPHVWRLRRALAGGAGDETVDVPVRPVVWTNHSEALLRAALDGAGISATTPEIAATHLARGELVRVLRPWNVGRPSVYAVLPTRKFLPQRVRVFLDHLSAQTQALLAALEPAPGRPDAPAAAPQRP